MSLENPGWSGGCVVVTEVGEAEGARGAAAALACTGADIDRPALLVEVGGRVPRPTLLASASAQALEKRIAIHLPKTRVAARGQICQLAVEPDAEGFQAAAAAVAVAREGLAVVYLGPALLQAFLDHPGSPRPSGVLLRAELACDRALVALAAADLIGRGLTVAVLKARLPWVSERRAFFGVAGVAGSSGLSVRLVNRLVPATRPTAFSRDTAEAIQARGAAS